MTDHDIAAHELSHVLCAALAIQKYHPHLFAKASAEIEVNAGGGHAIVLVGDDNAPSNVLRMMAMGPVLLGGIENLRSILRAKQIPLEGSKMSTADISGMLRHGGPDLSIADCEILCAGLRIIHDIHFPDVVAAVVAAKSLTMPLSQWFAPAMLSKALASGGETFMKLHDRYRHELPDWLAQSVERRFQHALAMSPAL